MSRKGKKHTVLDPQDLVNKINVKLQGGNAKVLNVKEISEGKFELEIQVPETNLSELVKSGNNLLKSQVKPLSRNPIFDSLRTSKEVEALQTKLEEARLKGAIKMANRLEKEGKSPAQVEKELARLDVNYRDVLGSSYLDLREKGAEETEALKLYKRSSEEYYRTGIYGTHLDLLSNFAATGFYNEINNAEIREFYDSWTKDVKFVDLVTKVFHSLFKYSVCYILRSTGAYEPHLDGISSIPGKEPNSESKAGKKAKMAHILGSHIRDKIPGYLLDYNEFSKRYNNERASLNGFPIAYTILDPQYIKIDSPGFFNSATVTISRSGLQSLRKTLEKVKQDPKSVSASVKESIKMLPTTLKKAAEEGTDYSFKDGEVSVIFLRKMDTESYAKPRGSRAFDAFDYREELKKADYATVDGIYNYILKITVGDKDFPVTDQQVLADLAEAFNTPQKAFSVVWNHTLNIEKITTKEVGSILGKQKYEPVDEEICAALGFARALIDGKGLSGDGAILITKGLKSEINAARQKVTDWVYTQYRDIAKVAGFSTFPVVRWKESVINTDSDAVTRASFMQMLDRKAISIQSYMREMEFDYDTEVQRMTEELPLIRADILRAGSPYQASASAGDSGRPIGQPTIDKQPDDPTNSPSTKTKVKSPSQASDEDKSWVDEVLIVLSKVNPTLREQIVSELNTLTDNTIDLKDKATSLSKIPLDKLLD